jgi:hypothetical protein
MKTDFQRVQQQFYRLAVLMHVMEPHLKAATIKEITSGWA